MPSDEKIPDEPWTICRLLTWTTDFLRRRGSESPRLDAEVMLAHVLDWQRVQLYTHYEEEVGEQARAVFRDLVRRRAEGSPVAYLVGRKEFYSLPLQVSAGRPHPPARVGVRGRRVPRSDQDHRSAAGRGCRHGIGLPGHRLHPPASLGHVHRHRHLSRGPGSGPRERRSARGVRPDRFPAREPARAGCRRTAVRLHRLEPSLYPHRGDRDPGGRSARLRAPRWLSTAVPTASAWSPGSSTRPCRF